MLRLGLSPSGAAPDGAVGELLRAVLGRLGAAAGEEDAVPSFLDGLEELLAELGGSATARHMAAALAAEENRERFADLRMALGRLVPGLEAGAPTARQLGYVLRAHHGRVAGGRALVKTRKKTHGVRWALRTTERRETA